MSHESNVDFSQPEPVEHDNTYRCRKCDNGAMAPAEEVNEMELTDTFICDQCGHRAIIPSVIIIISQLICGLVGGTVAGYLFVLQTAALMTAFQFGLKQDLSHSSLLVTTSFVFLVGFGYTLYQGFRGVMIRHLYAASS